MAWYMVWPEGLGRIYGMAWYGLADMALFTVWPGGHGMVFGMVCDGMAWYMLLAG